MSILDEIKQTHINSSEILRDESKTDDFDIFNPEPYRFALYIGTDDETFNLDVDTRSAIKALFGSYGDVRIAKISDNPKSARRWKIYSSSTKPNEIVIMFNFFGNSMSQARMIRSLCIILLSITTINHDPLTLYRMYIKCDPTHRNNPNVWWPPTTSFNISTVKLIASRTSYVDVKTKEIEHFGMRNFHFEPFTNIKHDYYDKIMARLERFKPGEMRSWFND